MTSHDEPRADELLTSWHARQRRSRRGRTLPEPKAVRNRKGDWRHPDIHPTKAWLRATAESLDVPAIRLVQHSLAKQYPALPLDFLVWQHPPCPTEYAGLTPAPRLGVSWCSRCLAEDFATCQPAHIRHQWVMAASGFCHRHRWPLEDRCNACGSQKWRFAAPARGPLRMICGSCWQPLERAAAPTLDAGKDIRACWDQMIAFEQQLINAIKGRMPDQFRFNFTSASQLLNEVRDVCNLLTRGPLTDDYWVCKTRNIALNDFVCDAMTPGYVGRQFYSIEAVNPLTTASPVLRRCLLAAACGIIDPNPRISTALFGSDAPPAIEIFVAGVDHSVVDHFLAATGRWSPPFIQEIQTARQCRARRTTLGRLKANVSALNRVFAEV